MTTANAERNLHQEFINLLAQNGPTPAQEIMNKLKLDGPTLAPIARQLKDGINGTVYVVQDGNIFDLAPQFKTPAQPQAQAQPVDDTAAAFGAAAPTPTPAQAQTAKGGAKKGGKKAAVGAAAAGQGQQASTKAPAAADEFDDIFDMDFDQMDTLTVEELIERIQTNAAAAQANFATGQRGNQLVAEVLCRWNHRAIRRVRGIRKGTMEVAPKKG